MKKIFGLSLAMAITCFFLGLPAWAQETTSSEFTLEEITVTAEKRTVNLQVVPSSVVAVQAEDLVTQGMISTKEMLDNIPNVTFLPGSGNTEGNVAIRGIQRMQVGAAGPGNEAILPSATAVYVDGIYLGIGGEYDLERMEVLRGPQGTLYGRSATGGVISFYTKDPKLGAFGAEFSTEVGSNSLVNMQGVLNVPVGEKVALRAAARYYTRDSFFAEGRATGSQEIKEGRLKARFQPTDQVNIVLEAATKELTKWSGGWSQVLNGPDDINYKKAGSYNAPAKGDTPDKFNQFGLNANYDFGDYTLTWIAGYHNYKHTALGPELIQTDAAGNTFGSKGDNMLYPKDWYHTEEVRLASDSDWKGMFTWLVGANYFQNEFSTELHNNVSQVYAVSPLAYDAGVRVGQGYIDQVIINTDGKFKNYGIFTEETFKLTDDFRITAGLRYDKTKLLSDLLFKEGLYQTHGPAGHLPYLVNGQMAFSILDTKATNPDGVPTDWSNITYKLRFEYDLTKDNMVYFTASSGFLPGFAGVTPDPKAGTWMFNVLDEQEMLAYEIGSKNQFLDNRLRLNGSIFYYDLKGYADSYSLNDTGKGPPGWTDVSLEKVSIYGMDVDSEFLMTANDKLTFNMGYLHTEITPPDTVTWTSGTVTPGSSLLEIDEQTGHPTLEGTLGYDHMFSFADGATLVPRVELHYTGGSYLRNYTYIEAQLGDDIKSFLYQDGYSTVNANVTWTAASGNYSVTGWVRNALDEEYKTGVTLPMVGDGNPLAGYTGVTPGDPRTFGLMLNVKF